jgi:hypothetical protein
MARALRPEAWLSRITSGQAVGDIAVPLGPHATPVEWLVKDRARRGNTCACRELYPIATGPAWSLRTSCPWAERARYLKCSS